MIAHILSRDVFVPSPRAGVAAHGASYYTRLSGGDLVSVHGYESRSDITDVAFTRVSHDNGRTWSAPTEVQTRFKRPEGVLQRYARAGYVDPATGRYISIWNEALLPGDDPLDGMRQTKLFYSVSENGGATASVSEQIICEGEKYNAIHPLPGVFIGKNCVMMGDITERPLTRSDGVILVPVQSSPLGRDGEYHNPGAGYTYTDCLLLMGRWERDGGIAWTASQRVVGEPERSTRGMIEPTIAELDDGTLIMVMRGSNDARPHLPGCKWVARSGDGGMTWTKPEPWDYTSGESFFSPSSCSQLIRYSDGRLFWMGNLCGTNPKGNSPRYPIVIGEVDRQSSLLVQSSVTVIDARQPGESEHLTLSNFTCREDRETHDLILHMTRLFAHDFRIGRSIDWTADALLYRIALLS